MSATTIEAPRLKVITDTEPDTAPDMLALLERTATLHSQTGWRMAALVYALVGPSGKNGRPKAITSDGFLPIETLAKRGIRGLGSINTIRKYRDAWEATGLPAWDGTEDSWVEPAVAWSERDTLKPDEDEHPEPDDTSENSSVNEPEPAQTDEPDFSEFDYDDDEPAPQPTNVTYVEGAQEAALDALAGLAAYNGVPTDETLYRKGREAVIRLARLYNLRVEVGDL